MEPRKRLTLLTHAAPVYRRTGAAEFFWKFVEPLSRLASLHQDERDKTRDHPTQRKGKMMKFMVLLYGDPVLEPQPGSPGFDPWLQGFFTQEERTRDYATVLSGEGLDPVQTATTISKRAGKRLIKDGPFAETREQLGGYYVIECADLDAAIRFAEASPAAETGSVEIRPVTVYE
jgi:hypothetical protein